MMFLLSPSLFFFLHFKKGKAKKNNSNPSPQITMAPDEGKKKEEVSEKGKGKEKESGKDKSSNGKKKEEKIVGNGKLPEVGKKKETGAGKDGKGVEGAKKGKTDGEGKGIQSDQEILEHIRIVTFDLFNRKNALIKKYPKYFELNDDYYVGLYHFLCLLNLNPSTGSLSGK
jgi:hypothetical protein